MVWRYSPQTVILRDKKWSSAGMIHIELHSNTELSDNIMVEVFFSSGVLIFSTFFSWHRVHSALSQPNTSFAKLYKLPERWDEQLTRLGITTEWQPPFLHCRPRKWGFFLHAGSLNASNGRLCIEKLIIYFKDTIEPSTITGCPVDYPQNGI